MSSVNKKSFRKLEHILKVNIALCENRHGNASLLNIYIKIENQLASVLIDP